MERCIGLRLITAMIIRLRPGDYIQVLELYPLHLVMANGHCVVTQLALALDSFQNWIARTRNARLARYSYGVRFAVCFSQE